MKKLWGLISNNAMEASHENDQINNPQHHGCVYAGCFEYDRATANARFSRASAMSSRPMAAPSTASPQFRAGDRNFNDRFRFDFDRRFRNVFFFNAGFPFGFPFGFPVAYPYPYYGYGYGYQGSANYGYGQGYEGSANGSVVVEVQRRLAQEGFYHGAIDGVMGSGTRSAIRGFQRANGLPVDGRIGAPVLSTMGLG